MINLLKFNDNTCLIKELKRIRYKIYIWEWMGVGTEIFLKNLYIE